MTDQRGADTPTRMLALWCPDWPVVAWRRAAPAGEDRNDVPVTVLESGRRGLVVRAASAEARAEGVTRGLRRREAEARCPGLVVVDVDRSAEAVAFEEVARALEDVTPRVEIERPGRLVFPLRGPARYFGGDEAVVERVVAAATDMGLPDVRVGVADGSFAAGLAARRARPGAGGSGRTMIVPPGDTPTFLAGLPVGAVTEAAADDDDREDLAELAALLRRLGLRTLGDFAALPERAVLARFARVGVRAHRRAHGLEADEAVLRTPPPELVRTCELDPPAQRMDMVAFAAKAMADELLDDLSRRGLACSRILVEAETEHGETLSRRWRHEGALTALALATRVHWQLESWLTGSGGAGGGDRPTAGLVLLRLVPDGIVAATGRQLGFWGGDAAADEAAKRTLVRVQGMLGVDAVVRPVRAGGRTPAERVQWVPWGEGDVPLAPAAPWPGRVPGPAPAIVHDRPVPVRLLDGQGRSVTVSGRGEVSAEPVRLESTELSGTVRSLAGPWPHDVRWWDRVTRSRRVLWQLLVEHDRGADACLVEVRGATATLTARYA